MIPTTSRYQGQEQIVCKSLIENCFTEPKYLESKAGQDDLAAHVNQRLNRNRERIIPWLQSVTPLHGKRILEIGAGTGSSTLALVEQGAEVTAVDIECSALKVAYDRCQAYGHEIECLVANAVDLKNHFFPKPFDMIIFYATLEHMTHEERRIAMPDTWGMLSPGGFWSVIETPNRLWFMDDHTSVLPFYNWLPDQVAFEYSKFSKRDYFKDEFKVNNPERMLQFLRQGRGVSYHEFELFIAPRNELNIVSCLDLFHRERNVDEKREWENSHNGIFEALLHSACKDLHQAFLQIELNFVIRKQ